MNLKREILKLEVNIKSYQPFWHEWAQNQECTLNKEERSIVELYLKNNFKINFFESLLFFNQTKRIKKLISKIILDYQDFKVWLTTKFVFSVLKLMRDNKFNDYFLHLPLDYISIPYELKNKLKLFKIKTVYEIFEKYNEEDLYKTPTFNNVMAFEIALKELKTN